MQPFACSSAPAVVVSLRCRKYVRPWLSQDVHQVRPRGHAGGIGDVGSPVLVYTNVVFHVKQRFSANRGLPLPLSATVFRVINKMHGRGLPRTACSKNARSAAAIVNITAAARMQAQVRRAREGQALGLRVVLGRGLRSRRVLVRHAHRTSSSGSDRVARYRARVQATQVLLSAPGAPHRIKCFDISLLACMCC